MLMLECYKLLHLHKMKHGTQLSSITCALEEMKQWESMPSRKESVTIPMILHLSNAVLAGLGSFPTAFCD